MMRDYLSLGSAPYEEDCAQVGDEDYVQHARSECERYIKLLKEIHGPEPEGARFSIKSFEHDFGRYYEVVCYYDTSYAASVEFAFSVENNLPATWEELM